MGLFDFLKNKKNSIQMIDPKELKPLPRVKRNFSEKEKQAIIYIEKTFGEVYPKSAEDWIADFERDLNPAQEIALFWYMADIYNKFVGKYKNSLEHRKELFKLLMLCSFGDNDYVMSQFQPKHLSQAEVNEIIKEVRKS
ncbi:MAG: hypothetical protein Q8R15_05320 [Candidatus Micrarchaeota archaeon]|nr:hypothetical protein [Candidatus Micrarchaeota archaeon]